MQPDTEKTEEIVDEDTFDDSQRDTLEEVDFSLINKIREQQSGETLRTEKAAAPTSTTLWVRHRGLYNRKVKAKKENQTEN